VRGRNSCSYQSAISSYAAVGAIITLPDCPGQPGNHAISHPAPAMSPTQRRRPR
jgi:hypothetical protein